MLFYLRVCKLQLLLKKYVRCKARDAKANGRVELPISSPNSHDYRKKKCKEDRYFRVQLSLRLTSVPDCSSLHWLPKVRKLLSKTSTKMNRTGTQTGETELDISWLLQRSLPTTDF